MLFLIGAAVAVLLGLLTGGRWERLGRLRIAWWWAAPVAMAVQLAAVYWPGRLPDGPFVLLILGSYGALLAIGLRNLALPAMRVASLGVAMNLAVMLANGGLMPVAPETLQMAGRVETWKVGDGTAGTRLAHSKDVILPREQTNLELLADRYWTGLPGRLSIIFSLGDVVLLVGMSALVFGAMRSEPAPRPTFRDEEQDDTTGTDHAAGGLRRDTAAVHH